MHNARLRRHSLSPHTHQCTPWVFHPLFLFIWILVCGFFSWGFLSSIQAMKESMNREKQAQSRLKEEEKRALELIDKLNKADTPLAKEKIIRDELQMQRPGETIIEIPPKNQ